VGVAAVLGAATFALASSADEGAAGPEEAVEALFAAVEDRDVVGVLDSFAPGERAAFQPVVEDVVDELRRLEVLADDLELDGVAGFELDVRDLALSSRELADGIAVVTVEGGTMTTTVRPDEVPLGDFVRELLDGSAEGLDEATTTSDLIEGDPVELVVVDDDGWHVSLGYTLAEAARVAAGAPLPDFGAGVEPAGADSPEGAVEAMVAAAVALDLEAVIALLPPGAASALHDYAPLFLPDAEAAVAELRSSAEVDVTLDRLDTDVTRDGDDASVAVTGFAVSGSIGGEPFSASFDGECLSLDTGGDTVEQCVDDVEAGAGLADGALGEGSGMVVVEVDGAWYLSPYRTVADAGLAVLALVEPGDLRDPEAFATRLFGGVNPFALGFATPGLFGPGGEGADPFAGCAAIYEDLAAEATDGEWAEAEAAFEACLEQA
jgi:hypothetical protein